MMHEKFREAAKAACYLGIGVAKDFPGCEFTVVMHAGPRFKQCRCTTEDLGKVVEFYTRRFPGASVYYYPEPETDLVAEIRCRCEEDNRRTCCRLSDDRPLIFVHLAQ
jgi:hypothetical protein